MAEEPLPVAVAAPAPSVETAEPERIVLAASIRRRPVLPATAERPDDAVEAAAVLARVAAAAVPVAPSRPEPPRPRPARVATAVLAVLIALLSLVQIAPLMFGG